MVGISRRDVFIGATAAIAGASVSRLLAHPHGDGPVGIWTQLAAMPFPVQEIYPTAFWRDLPGDNPLKPRRKGVLVNAGGLTTAAGFTNNVTDLVTVYDPDTDDWTYGPTLPEPRHHISLVHHNGYLFAISGFRRDARGGWQMQNTVWRVDDLAAAIWTPRTSLPVPQAETVTASLGGRLHVVGGRAPAGSRNLEWTDHIDTDLHWAYDAGADRWEARAPLPMARNSAAGAVYNNLLYVIGGRTVRDGNTASCHVYEPAADRWQKIAPLPAPVQQTSPRGQGGLAAAMWNGKIYAFGGEWFGATSGVYADAWEYDPREDKWRAVAAMPRPRHGLGAAALADGIYVCGGASGPSAQGTSDVLDRFEI